MPNKTQESDKKIETEDWIKEKIEGLTHDYNDPGIGDYGTRKYEVEFNNCNLIIRYKDDATHSHVFTKELSKKYIYETFEIPIKNLSRLSFNQANKVTHLVIKIKSNESLIKYEIQGDYGGYTHDTKNVSIITLYIPNDLLQDNLPERLTKAFDQLIELCGGNVTKEIF